MWTLHLRCAEFKRNEISRFHWPGSLSAVFTPTAQRKRSSVTAIGYEKSRRKKSSPMRTIRLCFVLHLAGHESRARRACRLVCASVQFKWLVESTKCWKVCFLFWINLGKCTSEERKSTLWNELRWELSQVHCHCCSPFHCPHGSFASKGEQHQRMIIRQSGEFMCECDRASYLNHLGKAGT